MHALERKELAETIGPLLIERTTEVLGDPVDGARVLVRIAAWANLEHAPSLEHFGTERRQRRAEHRSRTRNRPGRVLLDPSGSRECADVDAAEIRGSEIR